VAARETVGLHHAVKAFSQREVGAHLAKLVAGAKVKQMENETAPHYKIRRAGQQTGSPKE
jgi:hypothetical protein